MDSQGGLDQAKVEACNQKANNDISGGYITAMCSLGDELGLFRVLAERGPATSAELATRAIAFGLGDREPGVRTLTR